MIFQQTLLLIAVYVTCAQAAKLPSYFTKCKKIDPNIGECIVQSGNAGMAQFSKGDDDYHIPSLSPLKVPEMYIDVNGGLYINLTDVEFPGLEQTVLKKAKKFFYSEFILDEPTLNYSFEYDLKQRGKNEYMVPKNTVTTYIAKQVHYQLDNLFNGNVQLGAQMNKFLNENWKEVDGEIGLKLGEAAGEVISALLTNFFAKVPFAELFED
ncbi:uncharacterized protein CBL_12066 [Carabus blaptoides fortunei]